MSNMQKKPRKKIKGAVYFDYSLLAVLVFLVCFGLVMLYSSSAYGAPGKNTMTACIILRDRSSFACWDLQECMWFPGSITMSISNGEGRFFIVLSC